MRSSSSSRPILEQTSTILGLSSNFPESYTHYKIWVKAFTFKNEGQSSEPIEVLTDVTGPGAPIFRNISCVNDKTLSMEWALPITFDRSVDYFVIQFRIQTPHHHQQQHTEFQVNVRDAERDFSEAHIVNDIMQANSQNFEYR